MTAIGYYRYKCSPRPQDNVLLDDEDEAKTNGEGNGQGGTVSDQTGNGGSRSTDADGSFDPANSRDN